MRPPPVNSGAWLLHHGEQCGDQQHEGDQPGDAQVEAGLHADHTQGHPGRDFLTNICRPDVQSKWNYVTATRMKPRPSKFNHRQV